MSAAAKRINCILRLRVSLSAGAESDQEGKHDSGITVGSEDVGGINKFVNAMISLTFGSKRKTLNACSSPDTLAAIVNLESLGTLL